MSYDTLSGSFAHAYKMITGQTSIFLTDENTTDLLRRFLVNLKFNLAQFKEELRKEVEEHDGKIELYHYFKCSKSKTNQSDVRWFSVDPTGFYEFGTSIYYFAEAMRCLAVLSINDTYDKVDKLLPTWRQELAELGWLNGYGEETCEPFNHPDLGTTLSYHDNNGELQTLYVRLPILYHWEVLCDWLYKSSSSNS